MAVRGGWMDKPFSYFYKSIENSRNGEKDLFYRFILELGIYSNQLEIIYQKFPKENVKVIIYDDLKVNPKSICSELFKWLGIESSFSPNFSKKHNQGGAERSKFLGQLIKNLRQRSNIVKRLVRNVLPERTFVALTQKIYSLNSKQEQYAPMTEEQKKDLLNFYSPFNDKCEKILGVDLSGWN